jgi:formiminotetrahydrofolate cyclodeaminase
MGAGYVDGSIRAFLDKLAGSSPEPGGGSVAALTGALGAGLVSMVASLTRGKEKYASVQDPSRKPSATPCRPSSRRTPKCTPRSQRL